MPKELDRLVHEVATAIARHKEAEAAAKIADETQYKASRAEAAARMTLHEYVGGMVERAGTAPPRDAEEE